MALIVLNPGENRLEHSLADHPSPYLVSPRGIRTLDGAVGVPLGIFADSVYPIGEEALGPGDVLLLYTDGLSEARRGAALFGDEELPTQASTLLQRPFVGEAERLVECAIEYGQGELRDDTVVVLVKVSS